MALVSPALRKICDTSADYVEDTYQDFVVAEDRDQLMGAMQELHDMNPPPMNTESVIEQQPQSSREMPRYCTACTQPTKEHKNITNFPRSQLPAE